MKKILFLFFLTSFLLLNIKFSFANDKTVPYLCAMGEAYYRQGNYSNALSEFGQALELDPDNKAAKEYISRIFQEELSTARARPRKQTDRRFCKAAEKELAREQDAEERGLPASLGLKTYNWEAGPEVFYFKYKEPGLMQNAGMMYGLMGSYTYHSGVMLRGEGRYAYGKVDYSSVDTGDTDNDDNYILEFRGLLGYDFPFVSENYSYVCPSLGDSVITPYIGIAYRYLNNDSTGKQTTTGHWGYERESNYFYSPIGIEALTAFDNGWRVGAKFEYDLFWNGRQISHLGDVTDYDSTWGYYTFAAEDVKNDQDKGYGLRGSLRLEKESEEFDFIIEPFIRYWNIKKSDEVTRTTISSNGWLLSEVGYEPKNTTLEYGCKFALKF